MAGKDEYENTWADQWDFDNETEPSKQQKKAMMAEKLEEGLNKTKEGAIKGMKKAKDGASVGFLWIKDKCTKKNPNE